MDLPLKDYQALAEFRHHLRLFLHFSEEQARAHELEPQQHQAMLALKGLPPEVRPTVRELSTRLLLRHHTTVELVNRLESAGLVRRASDPEDRRSILIHLTKKGEMKLSNLARAHQDELRVKGPQLARALWAILRESRPHSA